MNRVFRYILATVLSLIVLAPIAAAVEYQGIGGRPANPVKDNPRTQSIFVYELDPGSSKEDAVRVFNNTDTTRTITLDAVDSVLSSGGAFACAQSADAKSDVGAWTVLSKTKLVLPAGGSATVPFTVTVPKEVAVGEHDGCITIQDKSNKQTNADGGVVLGFRSGIRMAVSIPGDIVKRLEIDSLEVKERKKDTFRVVPTVSNKGNVSLDTDVTVSFQTLFGTTIGETITSTYPVLQRSTASWNLQLERPFWGGWYRAHTAVSYNNSTSAGLGETDGTTEEKELSSAVFFAPPTLAAALIELLILAAIAGVIGAYVQKQQDIQHIRAHWEDYVAKKDDTLVSLAKDRHVSWRKLARVNKVKAPYTLEKGKKLKVPPKHKG